MPQADDQTLAKARAFFEKAAKVAETDNFDYAIDMYLQGLRHAPDALMEGHLPLPQAACLSIMANTELCLSTIQP